ncbi:DNA phosphorothioation-dependent restriction protein DptG [Halorientalis sp. IM1011]|uniref:DNA phosphorothioation-dependent restriction protein DptG n=1 Tax=Halorientalis sp. IM1011 TaxID=1932360 RepID=UPI000A044850|nr:DNA phosphorothioation-dependent restriction protein DptG [Halorientalis sp. IM1011]
MTYSGFGFVPEFDSAPGRTNQRAYFPVSISATVREATFSETLSGILDAAPSHEIADLEKSFKDLPALDGDDETAEELWNAFTSGYGVSAKGFGRKNDEADYLVPFNHAVASAIEIDQRRWSRLYWLLMTDPGDGVVEDLHSEFVEGLFDMDISNLLEEIVISGIENLEGVELASDATEILSNQTPIEIDPLVPGCAEAFREDLKAWLNVRESESASRWMLGLRDILNYHYMMYVIQTAYTLQEEYETIKDGPPYEYSFDIIPVPFGLASETASESREFVDAWKGDGLSRALYDSWGRLAVLNHVVSVAMDSGNQIDAKPYTLSEALEAFPDELQQDVIDRLLDEFPDDQRPDVDSDLGDVAIRFTHSVRRYYENMGKTPSSQTAYSAGENSVRDLGTGAERQFIERRRGVGTILRLDRGSLRLFARLFDARKQRGHIDEFWEYMRGRGIRFDRRSKEEVISQLEAMGLLQKQSDSGEAMYVETL